jgi:hypothetical protein
MRKRESISNRLDYKEKEKYRGKKDVMYKRREEEKLKQKKGK